MVFLFLFFQQNLVTFLQELKQPQTTTTGSIVQQPLEPSTEQAVDSRQREKEILHSRRLNDNPTTLEDLSKKYKISRERVRQIENKAFEKLQKHMLLLAKSKNLLPVN